MKVMMLVEANYPLDIRVRQEALKLKEHGHQIAVIAIKERGQKFSETVNGVKVYRIPKIELFKRGKHLITTKRTAMGKLVTVAKAILGYGFEFSYFTLACYMLSWFVFFRDGFTVIHTHNPPDTLFIVALLWKPFGTKFVYDHHDLSPDLFLEKYGKKGKFVYKLLLFLERMSCRTADIIIATNESYKKIEIERCGVPSEKIYVVRNGPNLKEMRISKPIKDIRRRAHTILCYLGAINIQDGLDYLLEALKELVYAFGYNDVLLLVVGDGDYLTKIKELAKQLKLDNHIFFTGLITDRKELCRLLSTADIFVDAAPKSFLNDSSTFIKHMEYMIFGKPVVSFELKESMYSLNGAGVFAKPNDTEDMAKKILELINDENRRARIGRVARERVKCLSWEKVSIPLVQAYKELERL
ncbi:MAG: glycosyltransferase WbuB [Deltaproteobacteria bacterium]|nr:MAG: glycosyltransferase WbuB [Deltaproteobacteria bacterium]